MVTTTRFALLRAFAFSSLVSLAGALPFAHGQQAESDFAIDLAVVEHQMAFDKTAFTVAAGSTVTIRFENNDGMIHNFILARKSGGESVYMEIAQAVLDLGSQAFERHFVPEGDLVLANSPLLQPGDSATITFTAPSKIGPYPYVCTIFGHARTMNGIMHVTADGRPPETKSASGFSELHYRYYEGQWSRMPDFDQMTPVAQGRVPGDLIALDLSRQEDNFGFVFTGKLPVAEAGKHLFLLRSDDGSMLYINGDLVIDHDGPHGDGEVKLAEIDLATGEHEVRVEYFEGAVAHNLHLDWVGPEGQETRLPPLSAQGRIADVRRFIVEVGDEPQVWRVLLPDSSPRAITVGLPGGISYSFDPEAAAVQYAWQGRFLNRGGMVGHGQGRGPESVEILGSRFHVGTVEKPLRIGDPATEPAIRWLGYRNTGRQLALMYEINGDKVTQIVEAAPNGAAGLVHHFEFATPPRDPVHFLVEGDGLELSASAGNWSRSGLAVPANEARRFSVTVLNPGN